MAHDHHEALDDVLNTVELLETVLLHLDMQTLLHAQRVSKYFRATITGSIRLQQALWFKPPSIALSKPQANPLISRFREKLGISMICLDVDAIPIPQGAASTLNIPYVGLNAEPDAIYCSGSWSWMEIVRTPLVSQVLLVGLSGTYQRKWGVPNGQQRQQFIINGSADELELRYTGSAYRVTMTRPTGKFAWTSGLEMSTPAGLPTLGEIRGFVGWRRRSKRQKELRAAGPTRVSS